MATQLAQLYPKRLEVPIVIRDIDAARVESRRSRPARDRREAPSTPLPRLARLGHDRLGRFEDCDLVLEAVFEELEREAGGLRRRRVRRRPECILATNTSALSVTEMGAGSGASRSGSSACTSSTRSR